MATITPHAPMLAPASHPPRASGLGLAVTAFNAIVRRDLVVTRREFISFLMQMLVQPLFFLFIFGKVLPEIGLASGGFGALLLPGIVSLTAMLAAMQGVALPLVLDLGFQREIDDRLLAPLPGIVVALEKVLIATLHGLIAGGVIFPLGWWILGSQYSVRTDQIPTLIGVLALTSLVGACIGLMLGTLITPEQIGLMFALIMTPMLFTGCTYYPWSSLSVLKWFQIVTLFNPLTYASEGLRYAMTPAIQIAGHAVMLQTLDMRWVLLALVVSSVGFFLIGSYTFMRRVRS